MALPKSLTQPIRQNQLMIGSGWRGYFAAFNQQLAVQTFSTSNGPTIYDLEVTNRFIDSTNGPPAGWADLGWIKNFKATPQSKTGNVITGYRGVIRAKYRAEVGEKLSITFAEASRMAMKIATGTQVFNLLKSSSSVSTSGPLSSSGVAAIAMGASGYVASGGVANYVGSPTLYVPAGSGANFPAGSFIVCDQDYNGTDFGFVGDAGAAVFQGSVTDVDFIRKTSDYVAGVAAVVPTAASGQDALILTKAFIGGGNAALGQTVYTTPRTGAKVQAVVGYSAREGGTYINEWSAIFLMDTMDRGQMLYYYPRLAPDVFTGLEAANLQGATSLQQSDMSASFDALAFDDPLDGETVVAYRAYFPPPGVQIQA